MIMELEVPEQTLVDAMSADGFVLIAAASMEPELLRYGSLDDWQAFAASWDDMAIDSYMADGGRYRRRRYARFRAPVNGAPERLPHGPHYQTTDYNRLNGGVERWFEPMDDADAASHSLDTVIRCGTGLFSQLAPEVREWNLEVHQFRIEARPDSQGLPTPEGLHRDGVDHVLVLLVRRHNIVSGTTSIHALDGTELGSFTLAQPFDAALVDDARVFHGVTPVEPQDPAQPAFRDVLVVTYRRVPIAR